MVIAMANLRTKIPLGISDFRRVREQDLTFIDKSLLIRDCLDDPSQVLLFPRPRRFGKTLNLSMLRCFLEKADQPLWHLFEGLAIAQAGDRYRAHFQRYPTIALTFKDVKARTWELCRAMMAQVIAQAYRDHRYLVKQGTLEPDEAADFQTIMGGRADEALLWPSLTRLSAQLARYHNERVLLVVDEYDTPIHAAYAGGYYDEAIEFFRNFLSGGLKDNPNLWKGILTGILRVAKDSLFSGLNNLEVYTLLRPEYATCFGFTEPEVKGLLDLDGQPDLLEMVQRWYNGYLFGGHVIYNPWSVLAFIKSADKEYRPHWAETSSNDVITELLVQRGLGFRGDMERLLRGEAIETDLAENVALRELQDDENLLWSFLLFSGYLKPLRTWRVGRTYRGVVAVPNEEVMSIFESQFAVWMNRGLGGERHRQELLKALLRGDAETCQRLLQQWLLSSVSFHDTARPPERFYHGFVLGLLVSLGPRYEVLSNPESGYGRCDVSVAPRQAGQPGVVLELKAVDEDQGETVEQALERALQQIRERAYAAGLRARGAEPVHEMAVVFAGKRVHVRAGG
jgi:hypothetical protein